MYGRPPNSAHSPHPQQLQAGYSAQQPQYPGQPPPQQYGQAYSQPASSPQPYAQTYNRPPPPPPPSGYQQQYPSSQQYNYQTPPYSPPGQNYNYQQSYPPTSQNQAYGYGQAPPPGGAQQGQYPGQQPGYPGGAPGGAPGRQYQPQGGYKQHILQFIQANGLGQVYPPNHPLIDQLASTAPAKIDAFCQRWRVSPEIGIDILGIALYDIILYIDDSGSMQFEQNGSRIDDLRAMLERIAYAATLFDDDGINIRFMNSVPPSQYTDHIRNDQQITQLMSNMQFRGLTPMGTELRKKVVDPFIVGKARAGQLRKPVLVITVTDGQPGGEPQNALEQTLDYCFGELNRTPLGSKGAAFQFVQVGDDAKAREFLGKLDENKRWGSSVDCTSDYENEEQEFMRQGQTLTPEYYMLKLLCGAIDRSYDKKDEHGGAAGGGNYGGPPGGGYGAPPPQGGYGAPPPGQYGAPPPGQYGAPQPGQGGYPGQQQQGYPPQQGGYPPQGYPPQGGGYGQNPRY